MLFVDLWPKILLTRIIQFVRRKVNIRYPQQPSKRKQPRGSGLKRPLNRRPPLLKRLEKEPLPPKRKLEPYKKNVNIRIPVVKKQELKPKPPLFQQTKR